MDRMLQYQIDESARQYNKTKDEKYKLEWHKKIKEAYEIYLKEMPTPNKKRR
jgi:hypothetical protein|tara:strand:- start:758 stop:913 length:156 start_codon:yes stop_codon:yes gene_type:complete